MNTLSFNELQNYTIEKYGYEKINEIPPKVKGNKGVIEDHELTVKIVDELGLLCKELSPFIVLFFAPPFVPVISSVIIQELNRF
ncbi:hypothetical protein [Neobacillus sp. LXY-1]|uniref:hypothetical protein n=1 Tax=Neobacillus sp. LXY-1 TaxID=3379133 RepID=UPI003EE33B49